MDLELRGRAAVVTGCSVGIGREIAQDEISPKARSISGERIHVDGGLRRAYWPPA